MKSTVLILVGIMITLAGNAMDRDEFNPKSEGMIHIPKGSYIIQKGLSTKVVEIDDIWMSNEITNKEFREFYEQVKNTPNDTIHWINYSKINPANRPGMSSTDPSFLEKSAYSDILPYLISFSVWDSVPLNQFYLYNSKYDNFPVVGVTYQGAMFFCLWKTKKVNKDIRKSKSKGNTLTVEYRLPTEFEWDYVASFKVTQQTDKRLRALHPINQGDQNELGLYNLAGNVSEWTCSSEKSDKNLRQVVKGSSWRSNPDLNARKMTIATETTKYNGFRIVCTITRTK